MLPPPEENIIPTERSTAELFTIYASILWHWVWLLILLAGLAGGTAYYLSSKQTPVYQASAMAMINYSMNSTDIYAAAYYGQQLGTSYAKIMTTRPVLSAVAQRLGLDNLKASVQVSTIQDTELMNVVVTGTDPQQAALIANTLVTVFGEQVYADQASRFIDSEKSLNDQMSMLDQQIQATSSDLAAITLEIQNDNEQLVELRKNQTPQTQGEQNQTIQQLELSIQNKTNQQAQVQMILQNYRSSYANLLQSFEAIKLAESQSSAAIILKDPAVAPGSPIRPQPMRSAMLAAVAGLIVAGGIIFLIEFLDDTIRDPQEITRKWGLPVLGVIVRFDSNNGSDLVAVKQPRSPVSEAFRSIRTNLQFMSVDSPLRTLLITSPSPTDGKTTIAANLASVIAQSGRRTIVIDADLRRPRLHKTFELPNRIGLTNQFLHTGPDLLDEAIQQTKIEGLDVITSGSLPPNPSELLGSTRMSEILDQLKQQYTIIVLDTPPALVVTDAGALASRVDGVLLVVKPSITQRSTLNHVIEQLLQINAKLLGVVVNDVKVERSKYYYYRGYYYYNRKYSRGYHYGEGHEKTEQQPEASKN